MMPSELWRILRACRSKPVSFFFPSNVADYKKAVSFCNKCPVKQECLNYALENEIVYGVWGGTGEKDRRVILSKKTKGFY